MCCDCVSPTGSSVRWILISCILVAAMILGQIIGWASLPEVHVSYRTRKCVRVVPKESGTCQHPPKKYETVWVP